MSEEGDGTGDAGGAGPEADESGPTVDTADTADDALATAAADATHLRVHRGERPDGTPAGGVVTVVVDRPDARNALNAAVRRELTAVFGAIPDAEDARVVVLTGSDESSAFVAGADVRELRERGVVEQRVASRRPRVYETVGDCPVPVVARVNGHALGGGCELAQACDVRYAREDAKLGQPEVGLGIMPGGGGTQRLPRLVGLGRAMELVLTGELVDGTEAADLGLVDGAYPATALDDAVYDLATSVADQPPVAVRHATEALRASQRLDLDAGLGHERELFVELFATRDKDEGIDAFLEDREPEWSGE
jgi:enoyl-CoA hydratase